MFSLSNEQGAALYVLSQPIAEAATRAAVVAQPESIHQALEKMAGGKNITPGQRIAIYEFGQTLRLHASLAEKGYGPWNAAMNTGVLTHKHLLRSFAAGSRLCGNGVVKPIEVTQEGLTVRVGMFRVAPETLPALRPAASAVLLSLFKAANARLALSGIKVHTPPDFQWVTSLQQHMRLARNAA